MILLEIDIDTFFENLFWWVKVFFLSLTSLFCETKSSRQHQIMPSLTGMYLFYFLLMQPRIEQDIDKMEVLYALLEGHIGRRIKLYTYECGEPVMVLLNGGWKIVLVLFFLSLFSCLSFPFSSKWRAFVDLFEILVFGLDASTLLKDG